MTGEGLRLGGAGYESKTEEQAHVFFQLIDTSFETGSIAMTSTKPFSKWAELMSDEAVATAMLDRLLRHALVYSLKGDLFRMRDRLRVGAVGFDRWHADRKNQAGEKRKIEPALTRMRPGPCLTFPRHV